jgi:4-hydroxymandelate synthase
MRIQGFDHVEFYVGDLAQAAGVLCDAFGFRVAGRQTAEVADAGLRSLLLRQGQIDVVLTTAAAPDHPAARYVRQHGDGPAVIAFRTDDVRRASAEFSAAGATLLAPPSFSGDGTDRVGTAMVGGFGDVTHRLVERASGGTQFAPGTIEMLPDDGTDDGLLLSLDHVAACLPAGDLDKTVQFYHDVYGLTQIFDERIEVGGQAMLSKVVQDDEGQVTFTLIEPDLTRDPGQIDEFLQAHDGPGVQHLAFRTAQIGPAIREMSGRGVEFLVAPAGYYTTLEARLGALAIPVEVLRELNVLADTDRWGQMFQIFARSTHERRTFFIELIERRGALTFGTRNIKALYEALETEREQTSQLT